MRVRRTLVSIAAVVATAAGMLVAAGPANAAGPWFVATTGNNAAACTSAAAPCATVAGVLAKGGFVNGDTINVAAGTYVGSTTVGRGANIVGSAPGVIFDGNNADSTMIVFSTTPVKLTNLTLRGGFKTGVLGAGGGLAVAAGNVTTTDVTITGNKAGFGGGASVGSGSSLTMTGGSISGNTANVPTGGSFGGWGGAVYVAGKTLSAPTGVLSLSDVTLNDNVASGGAVSISGLGGAILNAGTATIDGSSFSNNRATGTASLAGYGGAIYHGASAPAVPQMTITDTTISGGAATSNAVVGGGIYAANQLDATGLTLSGNSALLGGGLYTVSPATTLSDSTVKQNKATFAGGGSGGGIAAARPTSTTTSTITLDDTDVTGNTSTSLGGGLTVAAGVTSEVRNGSKITGNSAVSGGGVYNVNALTVRDSAVDDNAASFQGGGIYNGSTVAADSPTVALIDSSVDDNTAASAGGGVMTIKGAGTSAMGGHLNGNGALGGGGLWVDPGAFATIDGTDFVGNTASTVGGGAILNGGSTAVSSSTLRDNKAVHTTGTTGLGAAIYSGSSAANAVTSLTVRSSTISGNEAYAAAAVLTFSTGAGSSNKASIDNSTITENTNSSSIGALEFVHPVTITNSTITDNTAVGGSGALYRFASGPVGVAGTIISGNSGPECNAAVTDGGRNLSDPSDNSCGFTPAKNDVSAAPQLGALADNGGPTKTRLPGPASPALDKIPAGTATGISDVVAGSPVVLCGSGNKDQRGTSRPQGAKCDIGSVEVAQVVPTVNGPASVDYTLNSAGPSVTYTTTGTPQATLSYSGTLPQGLTFVDNGDGTATLSGTPTSAHGGDFTITVKGTNEAGAGTKTVHVIVHEAPTLTGPSASTYTVGQAGGPDVFEQTVGFPLATLTSMGVLPGGVTFSSEPAGKGTYSGTPTAGTGGVYDFTVTADNGTPPPASRTFTLTVNEAPGITGPASSTFTVGEFGSSPPFDASGYPTPDLTATGLPDGLSLSGQGTASITGNPADGTGGEYDATIKATNGIGEDATKTAHVVVREAPELVGPSMARFVADSSNEVVFSAGGYPAADLTATGDLPAGVTFTDHHNGSATLGGTPTQASVGTYDITVRASNGVDPDSVVHLSLTVVSVPEITSTSLPDAPYRSTYNAFVAVSGGLPPYTFSVVGGSLPDGLTLNADGSVTGSATGDPGTSTFTVKVVDSADPSESTTREVSIKVVRGATTLQVDPVLDNKIHVVNATLTGGAPAQPISGQTVVFKAGSTTVCTGVTNDAGRASCRISGIAFLQITMAGGLTASYSGSTVWLPSSGSSQVIG